MLTYVKIKHIEYLSPDDAIRWLVFIVTSRFGHYDTDDVCYLENTLWSMFNDRYILESAQQHLYRVQLMNSIISQHNIQFVRNNNYSIHSIIALIDEYIKYMKCLDASHTETLSDVELGDAIMIDNIITRHKQNMLVVCGIAHIEGISEGLLSNGYTISKLANTIFK